ncbi:hypothetical protein T09_1314 [Trichinella sp. T9]|nr:hypothetical protein T09_1314 [Trichinella sp. T9]
MDKIGIAFQVSVICNLGIILQQQIGTKSEFQIFEKHIIVTRMESQNLKISPKLQFYEPN